MKNQVSLLRKESFGGTISNAISGKRIYITLPEFQWIKDEMVVPYDIQVELKATSNKVIIREPNVLPVDNFSAPDVIFFELSRECNLYCAHCLNNSGEVLPAEIPHKRRVALLDDFCKAGVQEIRFTGGEPLLVPQIFDYISKIREDGLRASIGTNGTLVDAMVVKKLSKADLNVAIVSVDGLENKHDSIRGVGTFRKTLKGIELLIEAHIPVRVNLVAMKSNLAEIPNVVKYFFDRNVPIMIRRLIPSGRAIGTQERLTTEDYNFLRSKLEQFLSSPKKNVSGHYLKEEEIIPRIKLPFAWHKCKAGRRGLSISPDGRIHTCGFLEPLGVSSIGNFRTKNLSSVWGHSCAPETHCMAAAMAKKDNFVQEKTRRGNK